MSTISDDKALANLSALLQIEKAARHAASVAELGHVVTSETRRLIPYSLSICWMYKPVKGVKVIGVSNVSDLDPHAPVVLFFQALIDSLDEQGLLTEPHVLEKSQVPEEFKSQSEDWLEPFTLFHPLRAPDGELVGGLILCGEQSWQDAQLKLLGRMADSYAHALKALTAEQRLFSGAVDWLKHHRRWVIGVMLVLLFFPVRQSVIATAEVTPKTPDVVASPLKGVIKNVLVEPGQDIEIGTVLFELDTEEITNELNIASNALSVAQAEYLKNAQEAFSCDECKARLQPLSATVEQKKAEVAYYRSLLERTRVKARKAGVVLFSDASDWIGRPVVIGERVMQIADPEAVKLTMELPIEDAIGFPPGADVVFYPVTSPLTAFDASLIYSSYDASPTPQGQVAYRMQAEFTDDHPRLGARGTAKIYGGWVVLSYYLLRKPLAVLRQFVAW